MLYNVQGEIREVIHICLGGYIYVLCDGKLLIFIMFVRIGYMCNWGKLMKETDSGQEGCIRISNRRVVFTKRPVLVLNVSSILFRRYEVVMASNMCLKF